MSSVIKILTGTFCTRETPLETKLKGTVRIDNLYFDLWSRNVARSSFFGTVNVLKFGRRGRGHVFTGWQFLSRVVLIRLCVL